MTVPNTCRYVIQQWHRFVFAGKYCNNMYTFSLIIRTGFWMEVICGKKIAKLVMNTELGVGLKHHLYDPGMVYLFIEKIKVMEIETCIPQAFHWPSFLPNLLCQMEVLLLSDKQLRNEVKCQGAPENVSTRVRLGPEQRD